MRDFAFIIPCYNEARRLPKIEKELFNFFHLAPFLKGKKAALIFVDDGSEDNTHELLELFKKYSTDACSVLVLNHQENRGKGAAIKTGVSAVAASAYGFTDADLSYAPEYIPAMLARLKHADLIVGERVNARQAGYSWLRQKGSYVTRFFLQALIGAPVPDTQCGFKFFSQDVARRVLPLVQQDRFSFDAEFVVRVHNAGLKVVSVPVPFEHKESSTVTFRDGIRYLIDLAALHDKLSKGWNKPFSWALFFLGVLISFTIFGWTLFRGYFFSDDFTWFWHAKQIIENPPYLFTLRMADFFSPVMNVFYSLFAGILTPFPAVFFLINIIVHALVSFLSARLTYLLTYSRIAAIISLILGAVAGGAYEPIVWVSANMHLFATLFIVFGAVAYLRFLEAGKVKYLFLTAISFLLALGTKETAIVFPGLLALLLAFRKIQKKAVPAPRAHGAFVFLIICLTVIYGMFEYLWHKESFTIKAGLWQLDIRAFARLPSALLDLFIPIQPFAAKLTDFSAFFITALSIIFFTTMLLHYRRVLQVFVGFGWIIISIMPLIFFKSIFWWDTLASRYTYLARVGVVIIIAGIISHHILRNSARYIIHFFATVLFIVSFAQIGFMLRAVNTEYDYTYKTGRTLVHAAKLLKRDRPQRVLVHWEHPFRENDAHILGALEVFAKLEPEQIIFLKRSEPIFLQKGDMILYWNPEPRQYELTSKPERDLIKINQY